eukprot:7465168-Alexandrium_andersonii.AAC.1
MRSAEEETSGREEKETARRREPEPGDFVCDRCNASFPATSEEMTCPQCNIAMWQVVEAAPPPSSLSAEGGAGPKPE